MTALLERSGLQEHPFLRNARAEFLNQLAIFEHEVEFQQNRIVVRENDYADKIYLILEGTIALEGGKSDEPIDIIGPGEVLGWSWLYPPYNSHFSARALTTVRALELNGPALLIRAEEDHTFGYELMKRVAACVIRRLDRVKKRLEQPH